jgi:glycosyltransferase involved in cell wall biosynthesis
MRILVVSQYYWPETFRITEVVQALRDEGCEVLVLTGQPNYPEGVPFKGYSWWSMRTEQHDGVTIFRVPLFPRGKGSALRIALNYLSFICFAAAFGPWLLRRRSIDSILVFAPSPILQAIPAIWLAKLKNASMVTWVQDLWPESLIATGFVRSPRILSAVSSLVRWIYRKSDLLLVQSQAFVDPVRKMAASTPVIYHPNPGDFAFSEPGKKEDCPINFGAGFNVVFTGNLGTVQALEAILDAAEILLEEAGITLYLIGSGSRSDWLRSEISRRNLDNVQLPGRFPLKAMPSIMSRASALLVSLVRSPIMSQTVPSKIQAYLAAGRPIIASLDGEGARVILEAGAGVASPAEDARGLSDAILLLRGLPTDELERMGRNARAYYEANFEPRLLSLKLKQYLLSLQKVSQ